MELVHVFLLMMYLGTGDDRRLMSQDMYFYSIDDCNYFASRLVRRYGNYGAIEWMDPKDRATAYCVPKSVTKNTIGKSITVY